ncbi:MAG TPA: hypothetical protein VGP83_17220 [Pyrinomonadaceae bacterium]|jgi:hypothetical protein|nr:hypothetical protein [Pyrinomonadaceae bacterium]
MTPYTGGLRVSLKETHRQATLLGLAVLCLQRPGWEEMLGEIADQLHGRQMWREFMRQNADTVQRL